MSSFGRRSHLAVHGPVDAAFEQNMCPPLISINKPTRTFYVRRLSSFQRLASSLIDNKEDVQAGLDQGPMRARVFVCVERRVFAGFLFACLALSFFVRSNSRTLTVAERCTKRTACVVWHEKWIANVKQRPTCMSLLGPARAGLQCHYN